MSDWILSSEKIPDYSQPVIFCTKHYKEDCTSYIHIGYREKTDVDGEHFRPSDESLGYILNPEAWMPLPNAPKKTKEEAIDE